MACLQSYQTGIANQQLTPSLRRGRSGRATQNQPSHCGVAGVALLYREEAIGAAATLHSIKKVSGASLWRQNFQLVVWFSSSSLLFFLNCRVLYAIQWHSGDNTGNAHHTLGHAPS